VLDVVVFLMIALAAAAVTALWAWRDHLVTHPLAARPSITVERAVDRWERLMIRIARNVPAMRHPAR